MYDLLYYIYDKSKDLFFDLIESDIIWITETLVWGKGRTGIVGCYLYILIYTNKIIVNRINGIAFIRISNEGFSYLVWDFGQRKASVKRQQPQGNLLH